jgi:tartrate/fumarate subfamily iron-sulfur-dependent hydro-lyase beta chain
MVVNLTPPLSDRIVRKLHIGDIVYVNGIIYTARDKAHLKILKSKNLPFDLTGQIVYHCGPLVRRDKALSTVVAAGPTTSARLNAVMPEFIKKTGIKAIIGKGGMDEKTLKSFQKYGCIYLAYTGGAAVIAAQSVKCIKNVYWQSLGMAEAVWVLEVNKFGPLIVTMDTKGGDLYKQVIKKAVRKVQ